jgi:hypothetical protein
MPKINLSQERQMATKLTVSADLARDYQNILRDTKRFYEQVKKSEIEKSELLQQVASSQRSKAENRYEKHRDLLQALDTLRDYHKHLLSLYKEKLDDFITICEEMILNNNERTHLQDIHSDLLRVGFSFERHGVDHPLLMQLDQDIKRGTLH